MGNLLLKYLEILLRDLLYFVAAALDIFALLCYIDKLVRSAAYSLVNA
jgi:hypothetical protein